MNGRISVAPRLVRLAAAMGLSLAASPLWAGAWHATATLGAPSPRFGHTAVWTGTEMIVWGGGDNNSALNSGGRYNPTTNTWTSTSTVNAPTPRSYQAAVWTGAEMIVWGGDAGRPGNLTYVPLASGGRYNPATDTWTVTAETNAPSGYADAVWTGTEMIVCCAAKGRYDPVTNTWRAVSTVNAPANGGNPIWTGSEMIVLAADSYLHTILYRYTPSTDSWTSSAHNEPAYGAFQGGIGGGFSAVWTGSEVIGWGGSFSIIGIWLGSGTRFNPGTGAWATTSSGEGSRSGQSAVWTGSEMLIWGGLSYYTARTYPPTYYYPTKGVRYDPVTNLWGAMVTANGPETRQYETALWTGSEMIIWGGMGGCTVTGCVTPVASGGRFDPATKPDLSVADGQIVEGHAGQSLMAFTLTLSESSPSTSITVDYALSDGTATVGSDFPATSRTFTIPAGRTAATLLVPILGDTDGESDETLTLTLSNSAQANLLRAQATGTILNDDPPAPATAVTQYRLYNPNTLEHLYTTDLNEYTVLPTKGWTAEGASSKLLTSGLYNGVATVPLFRMYHAGIQQHHWTTDANEVTTLAGGTGWAYEGVVAYLLSSQVSGTAPLYRMALASPALHLWTTDKNEYDTLATRGWIKEGIIGYVVP